MSPSPPFPPSPPTLNQRDLQTAGHTMMDEKLRPDALFERIMQARSLIQALGFAPTEPSLVFQDPVTKAVSCRSIGPVLRVGRWSREQDAERGSDLAFPALDNMSRPHFEVRAEEGFHILVNLGRAGTQVNGSTETVKEHLLRSGDIIYAAGATFIYTRGSHE